jgi:hypothetical protein
MPPIESLIQGSDKLLAIFGRWPSFHDAQVIEIQLLRKPAGQRGSHNNYPYLLAKIHVREMTKEVDARGYFVLKNHTLVTMRFSGMQGLKLEGFNDGNVIFGLEIQPNESADHANSKFHVEFDPSLGVGAIFDCSAIEVVDATPIASATTDR